MKVTKLHIKELRQFKNFTLDLTYPPGHEKAGLPLDKVCFIGQSGTGKTTLLKIIYGLTYSLNYLKKEIPIHECEQNIYLERKLNQLTNYNRVMIKKVQEGEETKEVLSNGWDEWSLKGEKIQFEKALEYFNQEKEKIKTHLIYFPADLKYTLENSDTPDISNKKIIDFSEQNISSVWNLVLSKIQAYQEEELKIRQNISKVVEVTTDPKKILKEVKILEKWRKTNFNPIQDIADKCLDELLKHFSLKVKTDLDIQKKEDLGFIKIKDYTEREIPSGLWSTGTKQIILSMLPLYFLKPENTIILFDEPERSLYPDIQRRIIEYYSNLTLDSQFFYATHSPIIAASFEPWEIIELKFDKKGFVYQEKYYEGENHIDNYFIDPRYLNYDLILKKIFDLKSTNTNERNEAIVQLTMLKNELDKLKSSGKLQTKQGKKIFSQFETLSKKLFWTVD